MRDISVYRTSKQSDLQTGSLVLQPDQETAFVVLTVLNGYLSIGPFDDAFEAVAPLDENQSVVVAGHLVEP